MLKSFIRQVAAHLGLEIRRLPDPDIPFERDITFDGGSMRFWIANPHAREWWSHPTLHLNAELRFLREMCPSGCVAFDVGAHHGLDSVLLAKWAGPSGRVYAFEANAENAVVLNANIALNRLTNCEAVYGAVGSTDGHISMRGEAVGMRGGTTRRVALTTLDTFMEKGGLPRVDVLKIDVEGFEAEVLRGARRLLQLRPAIALEIHLDDIQGYGTSPVELIGMLDLSRYEASLMVRPDWESLRPFGGADSLPAQGVVNLFLKPIGRPATA